MKMDDIASPEYREVLRATHDRQKWKWGGGGKQHAANIMEWAAKIGAKDILDYGCGRATLREAVGDVCPVFEFDPGIPSKSFEPKPADLVVCTDVLEHVETDRVEGVLKHLRALAIKGLYAQIATSPANLILTDGRNAHLTVQPKEWWLLGLKEAGFVIKQWTTPKGLLVWAV